MRRMNMANITLALEDVITLTSPIVLNHRCKGKGGKEAGSHLHIETISVTNVPWVELKRALEDTTSLAVESNGYWATKDDAPADWKGSWQEFKARNSKKSKLIVEYRPMTVEETLAAMTPEQLAEVQARAKELKKQQK
jgi:hypothetical protein